MQKIWTGLLSDLLLSQIEGTSENGLRKLEDLSTKTIWTDLCSGFGKENSDNWEETPKGTYIQMKKIFEEGKTIHTQHFSSLCGRLKGDTVPVEG